MADYILGLDLGPNSIGWAMLAARFEDGEPIETGFLDTRSAGHPPLGVRVFEEGLENFGTTKEKSLAQERRTKRSLRRTIARRRQRKEQLRIVLQDAGLLPTDPDVLAGVVSWDPYALRASALDAPLAPYELGRAIFHLAQRRGFKSNRKTAKAKAADDRTTLKEMSALSEAIRNSGARTLGEYLHRESLGGRSTSASHSVAPVHRGEVRLRRRHARSDLFLERPRRARRDHCKDEFDQILEAQRRLSGKPILSPEHEESVRHAMFDQRSFEITEERRRQAPSRANLHRAPQLKPCPLEEQELRARRSEWIAQRFRILKDIANLRVIEHGWKERPLAEGERSRLLELLSEQKEVKFDRMRKELGLPEESMFNLERGGREKLEGNELDATLAAALGKPRWRQLPESERSDLRELIEGTEDEEVLRRELARRAVPEPGIEKVLKLGPEDRYLAYSRKALKNLVPHLERGCNEYEAIERAYPRSGEAVVWPCLPSLVTPRIPPDLAAITNPVVRRALVEVRKVVNAIIRLHGRPKRIVVELAREMHQGAKARAEHASMLREREATRSSAREEVIRCQASTRASRSDVDAYLMWKEQGGLCLYTGKVIPQEALFTAQLEVDHVLPRWSSLDDSRGNKVLCFADANHSKGQRTLAEWLGVETTEFHQVLSRTEDQCRQNGLPWAVLSRMRQEHVDADDFAARQLNDTRYISRLVTRYVALLYPSEERVGQKAILTTRGSLTAELRRRWGLNDVLDPLLDAAGEPLPDYEERNGRRVKLRIDHRHHAVDALVVAFSSRARLKRYQDFWKRLDRTSPRPSTPPIGFELPWPSLREDVAREAERIVVSHRVSRKIAGAFHADTYYGQVRSASGQVLEGVYVTRKRLDELTDQVVSDASGKTGIVDPETRRVILERLDAMGWDGVQALPKDWWREELRRPSGIPIRRVRVRVSIGDAIDLGHRFARSESNHHLAFDPLTSPEDRLTGRVRTTLDVAIAVRKRGEQPLGSSQDLPQSLFPVARTLARNEMLEVVVPETGRRVVSLVQKISGPKRRTTGIKLTLRDIRDSRPASTGNKTPLKQVSTLRTLLDWQARKVEVDPLGRVFPSGD